MQELYQSFSEISWLGKGRREQYFQFFESTQETVEALYRLEEAIKHKDFLMPPKLESSSKLLEEIQKDPMKVSNRSISMPADCIEKIYKNSGE